MVHRVLQDTIERTQQHAVSRLDHPQRPERHNAFRIIVARLRNGRGRVPRMRRTQRHLAIHVVSGFPGGRSHTLGAPQIRDQSMGSNRSPDRPHSMSPCTTGKVRSCR